MVLERRYLFPVQNMIDVVETWLCRYPGKGMPGYNRDFRLLADKCSPASLCRGIRKPVRIKCNPVSLNRGICKPTQTKCNPVSLHRGKM